MPTEEAIKPIAIAIAIGLLLGVEREKRKGEGPTRAAAGIRTFLLVALSGAICGLLADPLLMFLGGAFIAGAALLSYHRSSNEDPGLTTEVALLVCYLLGILATRNPTLAASLGVVTAVVLAARSRLHHFVQNTLTQDELNDLLLFASAALIILPLMPNRGFGPFAAFNPFTLWRLVVIMMAVGGAGYIALRALGPRYGLALAGFLSGFVSSAATVGAMASRSKNEPSIQLPAIAGAILSCLATVAQLLLIVGATSPATLSAILWPMIFSGLTIAGFGLAATWRSMKIESHPHIRSSGAFDLKTALALAFTVSLVMMISAALLHYYGNRGLLIATGLAGFADAHSAAISAAGLAQNGSLTPQQAAPAILLAYTTNAITKAVLAVTSGPAAYSRWLLLSLVAAVLTAWLPLLFF